MNLFRSEEHARNWSGFRDEAAGGLLPLADIMTIFSGAMFRERLDPRFLSNLPGLRAEFLGRLKNVTGGDPFWSVP